MREIDKFKEEILKEYPRMVSGDEFTFACYPGVSCFNNCCRDVNIFLTPYDILRLKKALGMTSGEFLSKYTIMPFDENLKYPVVLLKMEDNEQKTCPFVKGEGCNVYADRPWSCRMYPLGMASAQATGDGPDPEFYFLLKEKDCRGLDEKKKWMVSEWLQDQGILEYNEAGKSFKDLTLHKFFQSGGNLSPEKVQMFFMACYDLDKFKDFVFGSSFLEKFKIDEDTRVRIKDDEMALMTFAHLWLMFSMFGEKVLNVKDDVLEAKKKEMESGKEKK